MNSTTTYDVGEFYGKGWQKKIVRRLKRLEKKRKHERDRQRSKHELDRRT